MLMRSAACCWVVASRRFFADKMAALSVSTGSPILDDMPSDNLSAIEDEITLLNNSQRMSATALSFLLEPGPRVFGRGYRSG